MQVELKNLSKFYDDAGERLDIIKSLDWGSEQGSNIALVGKSGVGKSTLLHLIAGIESPSSGEVHVGGVALHELNQDELAEFRRDNIALIFQMQNLLPDFSALENVYLPRLLAGELESLAKQEASEVLAQVGLADRVTHRPSELSGGEQQRVAIARALVQKPSLILADEPTGSLDLETGNDIKNLLMDLSKTSGISLIVVTHSRDLALSFDLVYEMSAGGALNSV